MENCGSQWCPGVAEPDFFFKHVTNMINHGPIMDKTWTKYGPNMDLARTCHGPNMGEHGGTKHGPNMDLAQT